MKTTIETTETTDTTETTMNTDPPPTDAPPPIQAPAPEPSPPAADPDSLHDLRTENEQLRATLRLRDARDQITTALASVGARSPELLFEASKESLRFDDEGRPRGIDSLLKSLRTKYPEQFGSDTVIPPSINAGSGMAPTGPPLTKEALAKMSPTEIARLDWTDVRRVLSGPN